MFDKLVILDTGGYQIYYGNPVDAVTYFKQSINLINSDQGEVSCGNVNLRTNFNIIETRVINEYGNFTSERKFSPEQWEDKSKKNIEIEKVKALKGSTSQLFKYSWLVEANQIILLAGYAFKIEQQAIHADQYSGGTTIAFILAFIVRYFNEDDPFRLDYVLQ